MNRPFCTMIAGLFLCLGYWNCSLLSLSEQGGSGADVETRIIGRIYTEAGIPAANTRVLLLPYNYNPVADPAPPDSQSDTTDASGSFCITAPGPGTFNIEAEQLALKTSVLACAITIDKNQDTAAVAPATLMQPGTLKAVLPGLPAGAAGYVYLPGTNRWARVAEGCAIVNFVPAGFVPAAYYADTIDTSRSFVIKTSFTVAAGGTTVIADYSAWKNSRRLYLNTAATGAGVSGDVCSFPVLVRLSSANFIFSQAKASGTDLRFTKTDGTPLACEIELWDAAAASAAVWVKVDTVHGNSSSRFIVMYWGNPEAAGVISNSAVFDTAAPAGFQGVWHLSQPTGGTAKDATQNRYDGTPSSPAPVGVAGAIGGGQRFDGVSSYIAMAGTAGSTLNFPENGTYTVSAWVSLDTLDDMYHPILSKGDNQYTLEIMDSCNCWEFSEYLDRKGWEQTHFPAVAKTWTYVTGVRNNAREYLFVDGICVDSVPEISAGSGPRSTAADFTLAKPVNPSGVMKYFCGMIDEVRVSSASLSADWIRLCYMNQKAVDQLVEFR